MKSSKVYYTQVEQDNEFEFICICENNKIKLYNDEACLQHERLSSENKFEINIFCMIESTHSRLNVQFSSCCY